MMRNDSVSAVNFNNFLISKMSAIIYSPIAYDYNKMNIIEVSIILLIFKRNSLNFSPGKSCNKILIHRKLGGSFKKNILLKIMLSMDESTRYYWLTCSARVLSSCSIPIFSNANLLASVVLCGTYWNTFISPWALCFRPNYSNLFLGIQQWIAKTIKEGRELRTVAGRGRFFLSLWS